ncbi:MAG: acetolactate synthase small subunit [Luteibacter sp.]|uniref:acetolactate synthase small subunit n=1 Tax=Rhodanobacteraceae TaxID=1775411 RepID=UPI00088F6C15|nr:MULTISPECIES: acetolactate synthase small subunit [Rhodanobacteraceae]MDQ7996486.1 acetolactate synthase small subunit [Luteibacter sp.]MDQ8050152.1 acetolactate synthase small subunit [Luteibacter sp.]SDG95813.1 acetolactate synthase, small subunit [Dyella sp. 333MFSha]SKB99332.1 acetolactate synthase, small subunit [Luteibacter sp. 22Crub2.1]
MRHLISMLLQNEAGALARVAGLFASRGYNIESLTVAATHDVDASRLTLVIFGDDDVVEQIIKQSAKLIDVIEIAELTRREHVERELLVARIEASHAAVDLCLAQFGGRMLQRAAGQSVVEYTGRADEVDAFLVALRVAGEIVDHARSGIAAIERPLAIA